MCDLAVTYFMLFYTKRTGRLHGLGGQNEIVVGWWLGNRRRRVGDGHLMQTNVDSLDFDVDARHGVDELFCLLLGHLLVQCDSEPGKSTQRAVFVRIIAFQPSMSQQ